MLFRSVVAFVVAPVRDFRGPFLVPVLGPIFGSQNRAPLLILISRTGFGDQFWDPKAASKVDPRIGIFFVFFLVSGSVF